jgi:hypothetical protein
MKDDDIEELMNIIDSTEAPEGGDVPRSEEDLYIEKYLNGGEHFLPVLAIQVVFRRETGIQDTKRLLRKLREQKVRHTNRPIGEGFYVDGETYDHFTSELKKTIGVRRYERKRSKKKKK